VRPRGNRVVVAAAVVASVFVLGSGCVPVAVGVRPAHPLSSREDRDDAPAGRGPTRPWFDDAVPDDDGEDVRARIAAAAAASLGERPVVVAGERFRFDCSGVVAGIYARAGVPVAPSGAPDTKGLYALVEQQGSLRRGHPLPGDLVFFDDTWDENGNGRVDDPLSHVGVVERVDDDGVVVFVHRAGGRILRSRLDPAHPHDHDDGHGRVRNHWLRAASGGWPGRTTGELFVAFGTLAVDDDQRLWARR
jgi:hypothetical protein